MQRRVPRRRKIFGEGRCRVEARASARPPVRSAHLDRGGSTAHPNRSGIEGDVRPMDCCRWVCPEHRFPCPSTPKTCRMTENKRPALSHNAAKGKSGWFLTCRRNRRDLRFRLTAPSCQALARSGSKRARERNLQSQSMPLLCQLATRMWSGRAERRAVHGAGVQTKGAGVRSRIAAARGSDHWKRPRLSASR